MSELRYYDRDSGCIRDDFSGSIYEHSGVCWIEKYRGSNELIDKEFDLLKSQHYCLDDRDRSLQEMCNLVHMKSGSLGVRKADHVIVVALDSGWKYLVYAYGGYEQIHKCK